METIQFVMVPILPKNVVIGFMLIAFMFSPPFFQKFLKFIPFKIIHPCKLHTSIINCNLLWIYWGASTFVDSTKVVDTLSIDIASIDLELFIGLILWGGCTRLILMVDCPRSTGLGHHYCLLVFFSSRKKIITKTKGMRPLKIILHKKPKEKGWDHLKGMFHIYMYQLKIYSKTSLTQKSISSWKVRHRPHHSPCHLWVSTFALV